MNKTDGHNTDLSVWWQCLSHRYKHGSAATYCTNIVLFHLHQGVFNTLIATIKAIIQLPVGLLPVEFTYNILTLFTPHTLILQEPYNKTCRLRNPTDTSSCFSIKYSLINMVICYYCFCCCFFTTAYWYATNYRHQARILNGRTQVNLSCEPPPIHKWSDLRQPNDL